MSKCEINPPFLVINSLISFSVYLPEKHISIKSVANTFPLLVGANGPSPFSPLFTSITLPFL